MIEAHIIAWNEAETIAFTIKHYQKFCARVIIHDNHSTDDTKSIALEMGCIVKPFGKEGELSDQAYRYLKNNCWKNTFAQWVIVVDADEILHINEHQLKRADESGKTIFKTTGWNVFSHDIPVNDWSEITYGHFDGNYSKSVMFRPKAITEINYHIGCHVASPKGIVRYTDDVLTLFHYRNVGGPERLVKRHNEYRPRMSKENMERNWGIHYLYTDEERISEWESKYQKSKPFLPVGSLC